MSQEPGVRSQKTEDRRKEYFSQRTQDSQRKDCGIMKIMEMNV